MHLAPDPNDEDFNKILKKYSPSEKRAVLGEVQNVPECLMPSRSRTPSTKSSQPSVTEQETHWNYLPIIYEFLYLISTVSVMIIFQCGNRIAVTLTELRWISPKTRLLKVSTIPKITTQNGLENGRYQMSILLRPLVSLKIQIPRSKINLIRSLLPKSQRNEYKTDQVRRNML